MEKEYNNSESQGNLVVIDGLEYELPPEYQGYFEVFDDETIGMIANGVLIKKFVELKMAFSSFGLSLALPPMKANALLRWAKQADSTDIKALPLIVQSHLGSLTYCAVRMMEALCDKKQEDRIAKVLVYFDRLSTQMTSVWEYLQTEATKGERKEIENAIRIKKILSEGGKFGARKTLEATKARATTDQERIIEAALYLLSTGAHYPYDELIGSVQKETQKSKNDRFSPTKIKNAFKAFGGIGELRKKAISNG